MMPDGGRVETRIDAHKQHAQIRSNHIRHGFPSGSLQLGPVWSVRRIGRVGIGSRRHTRLDVIRAAVQWDRRSYFGGQCSRFNRRNRGRGGLGGELCLGFFQFTAVDGQRGFHFGQALAVRAGGPFILEQSG